MALPSYAFAVLGLSIFSTLSCSNSFDDDFHEEIYIKPLQSGHLYTHFQFTTKWDVELNNSDAFSHYHVFPKSLGEVLARFSVQELHLTMTQGLWRHRKWGYPVVDAPPGAELWVWFQEGTQRVDEAWTDLINVLSGMFCASLNFMDAANTASPRFSFRPRGVATELYGRRSASLLRYAALPRENVCTENLTPWKKLLPCGSKAGIASLFNSLKLYDATYHSLGVHFRPICRNEDCKVTSLELSQTLSVVFEPAVYRGLQEWSFKKLFGRTLASVCPVAAVSRVYVDCSHNKSSDEFALSPPPTRSEAFTRAGRPMRFAVYDLTTFTAGDGALNLAARSSVGLRHDPVRPPTLHVHRFQTGTGVQQGGILSLLYNSHPTADLTVVLMETVPWFLRTFIHTLTVEAFNMSTSGTARTGSTLTPLRVRYSPAKDRRRCHQMELLLRLPASSMTRVHFAFERALLKWTEYPPDANHGFYVAAAVVSARLPPGGATDYTAPPQRSATIASILSGDGEEAPPVVTVHSETLLVSLPTPDFSMPYNVICLTCTVVAVAFGSIHNLTTRRFVATAATPPLTLRARLGAVWARLRRVRGGGGAAEGKGEGHGEGEGQAESAASGGESESKKDK